MNKNLIEKATPFIDLINKVFNGSPELIDNDTVYYCLLTEKVNGNMENIFELLHEGLEDFIYIDGINDNDKNRIRGFICTNGDRQIADIDNIFFVGELENNGHIAKNIVMDGNRFSELNIMNEYKYMICRVALLSHEIAIITKVQYFINAVENSDM